MFAGENSGRILPQRSNFAFSFSSAHAQCQDQPVSQRSKFKVCVCVSATFGIWKSQSWVSGICCRLMECDCVFGLVVWRCWRMCKEVATDFINEVEQESEVKTDSKFVSTNQTQNWKTFSKIHFWKSFSILTALCCVGSVLANPRALVKKKKESCPDLFLFY